MGKVIEYYFDCRKRNHCPDANDLRRVYKKALVTGKILASKLNMEDIKAKAAEIKRQFSGNDSPDDEKTEAPKSPIHIRARAKSNSSTSPSPATQAETNDIPRAPGVDPIEALEELGQKWKAKSISKADYQAERKRLLKLL